MKKFYTLVLAFIFQFSFAADVVPPIANAIANQILCDADGVQDGFTNFNLITYTPAILAGNPSPLSNYSVGFYTDAAFTVLITNPSTYVNVSNPQTVYVKVTHIPSGEFATTTVNLVVTLLTIPIFTQLASICQNSSAPILPTTSNNAIPITGTWSPATINTLNVGTNIMTFTPNPGQCAASTTMAITINAAPTINTVLPNFSTCDNEPNDNDGYYLYSLTDAVPYILNGLNPATHTVTFYHALSDAVGGFNAISNPGTYQASTGTVYVKVTNNASGCFSLAQLQTTIEQYPTPVIQTTNNSNTICVDYDTNNVSSPLTLNAVNNTAYLGTPPSYTYEWYMDGVLISGVSGPNYTINTPLPGNAGHFAVIMTSSTGLGCSRTSQEFTVNQSGAASPIGIGYSIVNNSGIQTLTVEVQGFGVYEYALDNGLPQASPVFQNVALGTHTISIIDMNGCGTTTIDNVDVNLVGTPPPTGNTTQSFGPGATLANIQVNGQNIQWFSGADRNTSSVALPLSTPLVHGVTYFASQKIGGYVSTSRLPVLVQLTLNTAEFSTNELVYYPNPVSDILNIQQGTLLKNVSIYTILGQVVLSKEVNASNLELNVSSLNPGTYFVKVTSDMSQHVFKIIKD